MLLNMYSLSLTVEEHTLLCLCLFMLWRSFLWVITDDDVAEIMLCWIQLYNSIWWHMLALP